MEEISLDRVKRVGRICRRHGIETPFARRHSLLQRPQEDDSSIELLENVLIHSD